MDNASAEFWTLVKREGWVASVSRAVLVEGSLSPPPSKLYPGTKCFMVTVTIDNNAEFYGFGPTAVIARKAAIHEACTSFQSLPAEKLELVRALEQEASSNSDSDNSEDEISCTLPVKQSESLTKHDSTEVWSIPGKVWSHSYVEHFSVDLIKALYQLANQKGVDIKYRTFWTKRPPVEVIVNVVGGGLMFEGRSKTKYFAQCEAAMKMMKAIEGWPDTITCGLGQRSAKAIPILLSKPSTILPHTVVHPNSRRPLMKLQPKPTSCPSMARPPLSLTSPGIYTRSITRETRQYPLQIIHPCLETYSRVESEDEFDSGKPSLGLQKAIPGSHIVGNTSSNAICRRARCDLADITGCKDVAFNPFDDPSTFYSDPFQFTVPLPRKSSKFISSYFGNPPWKDIRHANSDSARTRSPARYRHPVKQTHTSDHKIKANDYSMSSTLKSACKETSAKFRPNVGSEAILAEPVVSVKSKQDSPAKPETLPTHFLFLNKDIKESVQPSITENCKLPPTTCHNDVILNPKKRFVLTEELASNVYVSLPTEGSVI